MPELKTLQIDFPITDPGGTVTFVGPDAANSDITGTDNVQSDGGATSIITITVKDTANNAWVGVVPTFSAMSVITLFRGLISNYSQVNNFC